MEEDLEEDMTMATDWVVAMVPTISRFCTHSSTLHCSLWNTYRHCRGETLVDWVEEFMEASEGFMVDIMGE